MGECQAVFDFNTKTIKGLSVKHDEERLSSCLVDYQDEQVKDELEFDVDCKTQCEDYIEQWENVGEEKKSESELEKEFTNCIDGCKRKVNTLSIGSIRFDKRNTIVWDATMPISCRHLGADGFVSESVWDKKKVQSVFNKLEIIGCITDKNEIREWIHAHEFVERIYEPMEPELPALCYLHAKSVGGCRLDDLMRVVKEVMDG